ncbi:MAG TPA: HU family DNA-binding protein [Parapedobacter sp.]|uniref:HU family DNA-binding protein n=1 Tax=Parapedobacter sp. TaxID=1958893 RepID=UPI002BD1DF75|nr:HU family DNA-binding protein [Parapedobacter sp.]HWK56189.1 HU family DNA-binding protein [Parapedobacter sp.]
MAVKYVTVQQHDFRNPDKPRYIAQCKSRGHVDVRDISRDLSHASTLNAADIVAVIEGLIHTIGHALSDGYIVKLGDFGSFYLALEADSKNTPKEVNAHSIKGCKVYFRAGKELVRTLAETSFSTK